MFGTDIVMLERSWLAVVMLEHSWFVDIMVLERYILAMLERYVLAMLERSRLVVIMLNIHGLPIS